MATVSSTKSTLYLNPEQLAKTGVLLLPNNFHGEDLPRLAKLAEGRALLLIKEADAHYSNGALEDIRNSGLALTELAAVESIQKVRSHVNSGGMALYCPPSSVAHPATNVMVPKASLEALALLGVATQVAYVDHPKLSKFSVEPASRFRDAVIALGPVISTSEVSVARFWEDLLVAGNVAFETRPTFEDSLTKLIVLGMKQHGGTAMFYDGVDGSETSYHRLLAAAIVLADEIKASTKSPRIGIVLPPGKGALVANLAAMIAGKTPVNLNFTAGKESIESAMKQAELDRFLTADIFVRKMQTFPWPPLKSLIFLERLLPTLKPRILRWLALVKLLPGSVLVRMLGLPRVHQNDEATLLFTSGSSGDPKGVVLTHRNLVANVHQFATRLGFSPKEKILACLPLFHSLGCTVTLWYPMIEGISLVSYPSPMETPKLAELIEKYKVNLLLATPTFLRGYMRRVNPEQLASLKLVVTGAEKLPVSFEAEFSKKFNIPVMEGYGLTETSPATNFNLPDPVPNAGQADRPVIPSRRLGSVGHMLSGLAVRITDVNSEERLPVDQQGMIWLKGPNVFGGYLKQPRKTEEVLKESWFRTGDIGRLDNDGFLYIEGRLSRFSKIGGEMVPHETVEAHINRALGLEGESERKIAVVGVPDNDKGEALVLISTVAGESYKQELINLRYTLLEQGVPALWIPKRVVSVPSIPILQSGKLDIKTCERLATSA
jgi:acyl-[acyl-carrier-protein]-phospholipid O-acyltransferase / long-chain-fatty-acid--[acyl-carrier-protein] ligase